MSRLQETHAQYASFSDTVSCTGDLHVAPNAVVAVSVVADALEVPLIGSQHESPAIQADSVVTATLLVNAPPLAMGDVLTSDATGNASWQPLPAVPATFPPAYGYSFGEGANAIPGGTYITFDQGTVVNNSGFTSVPGPPTGSSYIIKTAGVYEYSFYVLASDGAGTTQPLEIALVSTSINFAVAIPPNTFRSALAAADGDGMVCRGSGFVTLTVGDLVSLQNITNSSGTSINLLPAGGGGGANRTFLLQRVA